MPWTAEQRDELRRAIDQSKREALEQSRQREAAAREWQARKQAERRAAQQARETVDMLRATAPIPRPLPRFCVYCGTPAAGGVCHAHSDLADKVVA